MPTVPTNANANKEQYRPGSSAALPLIGHIPHNRRAKPPTDSPEEAFFKGILRLNVTLRMKRTRHQLAPAMPVEEIIDGAVAGRMADRLLIGALEVVDVQHLAGPGGLGEARQQRRFRRDRHVLALALWAFFVTGPLLMA